MIKIHGMQKVVDKLKQEMSLLKVGQQVLVEWPGHFVVMLDKVTDSNLDLTMRYSDRKEFEAVVSGLGIHV